MTPEDMKAVWASHCKYEFELRDVEGALSTMVDDPYLWNIPTMCGGRGQDGMRRYYRDNFMGTMPADAAISSVSLTVGDDALVVHAPLPPDDGLVPSILGELPRSLL